MSALPTPVRRASRPPGSLDLHPGAPACPALLKGPSAGSASRTLLFFGHTKGHLGSRFPDQGPNPSHGRAPGVLTAGPPGARSRTPYALGWGLLWSLKEDVEGLTEPEWSADAERPAGVPLGLGLPGVCAVVTGRELPAWHWAGPVLVLAWVKPAGPAWQGGIASPWVWTHLPQVPLASVCGRVW